MNENLRSKNSSLIRRQIKAANLPESERRNLLELAGTAELLVDGVMWTARQVGGLWGNLFLKPSAKH